MRKLILIKHAMPNIDESVPSKEWLLSEEGKIKSKSLANYIKEYNVKHIYTSDEQKAIETGEIICKELNLDLKIHKNLHENDRTGLNYLTHDEYDKVFKSFFNNPFNNVVGNETAKGAQSRFIEAITDIIENNEAEEDIVIVAHGTVISLFVSNFNKVDTFPLWQSLELPSFVELTIPNYKIINVIKAVD